MAVYGYARVSTAAQAESSESLGTQQRTLEGYAMMHGLKLYKVFVERGVSGSKPLQDRHEGKRLLAALRPRRRGAHAEARPHVPLGARRPRCPRPAQEAGRIAAHDRPRRRRDRQRHLQAGVHDLERRGRGRARPHPRAHRRGEETTSGSAIATSAATSPSGST